MTQEFHISITAVGEERYLVRTEQVAPGTPLAEEQVVWPIADWLEQTQQLMHEPLMSLLAGHPPLRIATRPQDAEDSAVAAAVSANAPGLVMLGQQLYSALFQGMIRDSWLTAQGIAQHSQQLLRLRLGIKDSRLQKLPWEVLHDGDRPLATGTELTFCRYHSVLSSSQGTVAMPAAIASAASLRVLMVVSAPDDQEQLALKREVRQLQEELQPNQPDFGEHTSDFQLLQIDVTLLEQPGRAELTQALEQGNFQVLHYAGHSNLGKTGGDLFLVSHQTGLSEQLSGEDLAGLLVNNGVRLAVFNSCRGAYTDTDRAGGQEQNLAQALMNRGVPGVIAMSERIPDEVAVTFTRLLYRNLRQGYPIDLSLNRTRQGLISAYGSHQFYWALPVLYMHPRFDGSLTSQPSNQVMALDSLLFPDSTAAHLEDKPLPASDDADSLVAALEDDEDYDDDLAIVSNLLQQLSPSEAVTSNQSGQRSLSAESPLKSVERPSALDAPAGISAGAPMVENGALETASSTVALADSERSHPQPDAIASLPKRSRYQTKLWLPLVGVTIVIAGISAISILQPGAKQPTIDQILNDPELFSSVDQLDQTTNPVALATVAFNQDNQTLALEIIAELLERNRLKEATEAIEAASGNQRQNPEFLYLLGRLQWQRLVNGSGDYSANDAARSWANALEQRPNEIKYQVALGFARYAQADYQQAFEIWERAVAIDQQTQRLGPLIGNGSEDALVADPIALNAYAGLALALVQLADQQVNFEQRQRTLNTAKKYYLMVIQAAPEDFGNSQSLATNWLWQESTIADWQVLQERVLE